MLQTTKVEFAIKNPISVNEDNIINKIEESNNKVVKVKKKLSKK